MPITGRCLCEKVKYKISVSPISQGVCYCRQCQKAGGATGLLVLQTAAFEFSGTLSSYETNSDDGSRVERNFCPSCGSHVFAQILDVPGIVTVKASTLDDPDFFVPQYLVWTRSTGRSHAFPSEVPSFKKDAPLEVVLGIRSNN